ncbi:MAG: SDR family oxidoreductase [Parachlamydiaceae bacterium]
MKWTLITGGAIRLGAEIARELASTGRNIVIHYNRNRQAADVLKNELKTKGVYAESIQGDFSSRKSVSEFLGRYDFDTEFLIHNVGNYLIDKPLHTPIEAWEDLFQTNLFAPVQITQALAPSIIKNRGRIITIGVTGINSFRADTYANAYTQTKASLLGYTKGLAKELAEFGVTVNMVSPGRLENAVDLPDDPKTDPMGRPGKLSEITRVIKFLLEPESEYITGQNLEVAGALRL